jgi:hypothetical protein
MRTVRVNKIASVVYRLRLSKTITISDTLVPQSGNVVVGTILQEKRVYNLLELENGRMSKISRGDIFVGALGRRRSLQGFVGDIPGRLKSGDLLQLLNMGGVVGTSGMVHKDLGSPATLKILGMAVRNGHILNIRDRGLTPIDNLWDNHVAPVVLVSGTGQNSGKTYACGQIIKSLSQRGLKVHSGKLTGVACRRDSIAMEDHGAACCASFLEAGYPSTVGLDTWELVRMAHTIIGHLHKGEPDVIVLEMGDGIIGDYGGMAILGDATFLSFMKAHVFCAWDMVGAWGGLQFLQERDIPVHIIAGPATDTPAGVAYIRENLDKPAVNAYLEPEQLALAVMEHLQLETKGYNGCKNINSLKTQN